MSKKNNRGFTLMEMLIVVAVIAVLVAIAIPTFSSSLKKAQIAADKANCRAYYAETAMNCLVNSTNPAEVSATNSINVGGNAITLNEGTIAVEADDGTAPTKFTFTYSGDGTTWVLNAQ